MLDYLLGKDEHTQDCLFYTLRLGSPCTSCKAAVTCCVVSGGSRSRAGSTFSGLSWTPLASRFPRYALSEGIRKSTASPTLPMRAVRPTRCTYLPTTPTLMHIFNALSA